MPPLVIAAGVTAAGALGGAALASRASNKATSAAAKGNEASLAYTKEQDALARQDQAKREALWQQQYNAWNQMRNQALSRYGFEGSMPSVSGYESMGAAPSAGYGGGVPVQAGGSQPVSQSPYSQDRASLGELIARKGQLGGWNDWGELGLTR